MIPTLFPLKSVCLVLSFENVKHSHLHRECEPTLFSLWWKTIYTEPQRHQDLHDQAGVTWKQGARFVRVSLLLCLLVTVVALTSILISQDAHEKNVFFWSRRTLDVKLGTRSIILLNYKIHYAHCITSFLCKDFFEGKLMVQKISKA